MQFCSDQIHESNEFDFKADEFRDGDDGKTHDRADQENMLKHLEYNEESIRRLGAFFRQELVEQVENQASTIADSTSAGSRDKLDGAFNDRCKLTISLKGCHWLHTDLGLAVRCPALPLCVDLILNSLPLPRFESSTSTRNGSCQLEMYMSIR